MKNSGLGVEGSVTNKFIVLDFTQKSLAKYYDGIEKGSIPSDAAIRSISDTCVDVLISGAVGAAGGALTIAALGFLGVTSPVSIGVGAVIVGVAVSDNALESLTPLDQQIVQNIKNDMSETIKNTYIKFKGESNQ